MGAVWSKLSELARAALMGAFARISEEQSAAQVNQAVFALAAMGAQWKELPADLVHSLGAASQGTVGSALLPKDLPRYLLSLSQMGVKWPDLPLPLRESLTKELAGTEQFTSTKLIALARLLSDLRCRCDGPDFAPLRLKLSKDLAQRGFFRTPHELPTALNLLGKMRILWFELPTSALERELLRLSPAMDSVQTTLLLKGLAQLHAEWEDLSPATTQCVQQLVSRHQDAFSQTVSPPSVNIAFSLT